jgi:hypothetical protein
LIVAALRCALILIKIFNPASCGIAPQQARRPHGLAES